MANLQEQILKKKRKKAPARQMDGNKHAGDREVLQVKPNPLSQWQFLAVVDGIGLAPHVEPPCIGA